MTRLIVAAGACLAVATAGVATQQRAAINVLPVQRNVSMLVGPNGNSAVQVGSDGVLLVDAQEAALAAAEATFPVLEPIEVVDRAPLVDMPTLAAVPRADVTRRAAGAELPVYAAVTLLGIGVMRPRPWRKDGRS